MSTTDRAEVPLPANRHYVLLAYHTLADNRSTLADSTSRLLERQHDAIAPEAIEALRTRDESSFRQSVDVMPISSAPAPVQQPHAIYPSRTRSVRQFHGPYPSGEPTYPHQSNQTHPTSASNSIPASSDSSYAAKTPYNAINDVIAGHFHPVTVEDFVSQGNLVFRTPSVGEGEAAMPNEHLQMVRCYHGYDVAKDGHLVRLRDAADGSALWAGLNNISGADGMPPLHPAFMTLVGRHIPPSTLQGFTGVQRALATPSIVGNGPHLKPSAVSVDHTITAQAQRHEAHDQDNALHLEREHILEKHRFDIIGVTRGDGTVVELAVNDLLLENPESSAAIADAILQQHYGESATRATPHASPLSHTDIDATADASEYPHHGTGEPNSDVADGTITQTHQADMEPTDQPELDVLLELLFGEDTDLPVAGSSKRKAIEASDELAPEKRQRTVLAAYQENDSVSLEGAQDYILDFRDQAVKGGRTNEQGGTLGGYRRH